MTERASGMSPRTAARVLPTEGQAPALVASNDKIEEVLNLCREEFGHEAVLHGELVSYMLENFLFTDRGEVWGAPSAAELDGAGELVEDWLRAGILRLDPDEGSESEDAYVFVNEDEIEESEE